jgi:hypothetical protein
MTTTGGFAFRNVEAVTDEAIARAREMIGQELRIEQYNHEATFDSIRHYAFGIGDDNPLWCDEQYAASGPNGIMVAPPTFLYSVFAPGIAPSLEGLQPFQAGGDCTWNRLPRRGERIVATARLTGIDERRGGNVDRLIIEHGETEYRTTDGDLLAVFKSRSFRTPRPGADGALQYDKATSIEYSAKELEQIEHDVFAEEVRGNEPRYWDDVQIGDALTPVVKGPLDQMTMTCYYAGSLATSGYKASELKWKMWKRAHTDPLLVPNNYDITYYQERGMASAGHQNDGVAQTVGMPAAYDNGHQRIGWVAHLVTNWMSDHGFLKNLYTEIRRPNIYGNTVYLSGTVTDKLRDEDGASAVRIKISAVDQKGVENTRGTATVVLPTRSS